MDNETETIDAKGNSERKIYDINSILVQDIDKLGNITTYKYNDKGQQVETVDAYKNTTKFEYDKFGNVTKTTINDTPVEIKSSTTTTFMPGRSSPDSIRSRMER